MIAQNHAKNFSFLRKNNFMKSPNPIKFITPEFRKLFVFTTAIFIILWFYKSDIERVRVLRLSHWHRSYWALIPQDPAFWHNLIAIPLFFWAAKPLIKTSKNKRLTSGIVFAAYVLVCLILTRYLDHYEILTWEK